MLRAALAVSDFQCRQVHRVLKAGGHFRYSDMLRPSNKVAEKGYYLFAAADFVQGKQEGRVFHGRYGRYCFLPLPLPVCDSVE